MEREVLPESVPVLWGIEGGPCRCILLAMSFRSQGELPLRYKSGLLVSRLWINAALLIFSCAIPNEIGLLGSMGSNHVLASHL